MAFLGEGTGATALMGLVFGTASAVAAPSPAIISFFEGDSVTAVVSSTGCDLFNGVNRAGDLGAMEGVVTVSRAFFGVTTDGGANAAEKLGCFGRCMLLTGVDSTTFIGLDNAARGAGTNGVALDLKMPRPDEAGTGMALDLEAEEGDKVCSEAGFGVCTLRTGGLRDILGNAVVTSPCIEFRCIPPVSAVKSMVLPPILPVESPPSELRVVSASSSITGMGRSCPAKRSRAAAVSRSMLGGGDVGPSEWFTTAWRASQFALGTTSPLSDSSSGMVYSVRFDPSPLSLGAADSLRGRVEERRGPAIDGRPDTAVFIVMSISSWLSSMSMLELSLTADSRRFWGVDGSAAEPTSSSSR
jgi:hypothetical protein